MGRRARFTVEQVAEALKASGGLRYKAAASLGCSASTIRDYLARHPTLAEDIADEQERLLDVAEQTLRERLKAGDLRATMFYLNHQGASRGYGRGSRRYSAS